MFVKKGDKVKVITGKDKNKEGIVLETMPKKDKVLVEGVNIMKKHQKPSQTAPQGGIVEKEGGIHISNLMLVVKGQASRIGRKKDAKGNTVRYSKKSGEEIK